MKKNQKIVFAILLITLLNGCASSVIRYDPGADLNGSGIFGLNHERNFYYDAKTPDSLSKRWQGETNGNFGFNSVVTTNYLVFVSDLSGRIYCFNKQSGKRIGYLRNKGSIECAPIIRKNLLLFPLCNLNNQESDLIIYDYVKGTQLSKTEIEGKCISYPVADDQNIYLLTTSGNINKINFRGEILWTKKTKFKNSSNLFVYNSFIYFGAENGNLIKLDYSTGEKINEIPVSDAALGNISAAGGFLITSDFNGNVFAIKDDKIAWKYSTRDRLETYISSDKDNLYFGTLSGNIISLSTQSGVLRWINNFGGVINAAPLILRDQLLVPNLDRKVLFLDKQNGAIRKQIDFPGRIRLTPSIDSLNIYFGYDNYTLEAYAIN